MVGFGQSPDVTEIRASGVIGGAELADGGFGIVEIGPEGCDNGADVECREYLSSADTSPARRVPREGGESAAYDLSHRLLGRAEERRLIREAQATPRERWHSSRAVQTMFECNIRLVAAEAHRQSRISTLDTEDLMQEGIGGFFRALEKFDLDLGYRFSTYACWWIRQCITRARNKDGRPVRMPVRWRQSIARLARAHSELLAAGDRQPSSERLAQMLGWSVEDVLETQEMAELSRQFAASRSLDDQIDEASDGGSSKPLADIIADEDEEPVEESLLSGAASEALATALQEMEDEEREVLVRRYGIGGRETETLVDIGHSWGSSSERVRKVQIKAERKLKVRLSEQVIDAPSLMPADASNPAADQRRRSVRGHCERSRHMPDARPEHRWPAVGFAQPTLWTLPGAYSTSAAECGPPPKTEARPDSPSVKGRSGPHGAVSPSGGDEKPRTPLDSDREEDMQPAV